MNIQKISFEEVVYKVVYKNTTCAQSEGFLDKCLLDNFIATVFIISIVPYISVISTYFPCIHILEISDINKK